MGMLSPDIAIKFQLRLSASAPALVVGGGILIFFSFEPLAELCVQLFSTLAIWCWLMWLPFILVLSSEAGEPGICRETFPMLLSHGLQHPGRGLGCDAAVLEGLGGESRDGQVQGEGEASLGTALRW